MKSTKKYSKYYGVMRIVDRNMSEKTLQRRRTLELPDQSSSVQM